MRLSIENEIEAGRHTAHGHNEANHKDQSGGFTSSLKLKLFPVLPLLHLRCHNGRALVSSDLTNITSAVYLILFLYLLPLYDETTDTTLIERYVSMAMSQLQQQATICFLPILEWHNLHAFRSKINICKSICGCRDANLRSETNLDYCLSLPTGLQLKQYFMMVLIMNQDSGDK